MEPLTWNLTGWTPNVGNSWTLRRFLEAYVHIRTDGVSDVILCPNCVQDCGFWRSEAAHGLHAVSCEHTHMSRKSLIGLISFEISREFWRSHIEIWHLSPFHNFLNVYFSKRRSQRLRYADNLGIAHFSAHLIRVSDTPIIWALFILAHIWLFVVIW